jgi:hypothetical protein
MIPIGARLPVCGAESAQINKLHLSHPCLVSAAVLALGAVARKLAPLMWVMDACARDPRLKLGLEIERAREPRLEFSPCRSFRIAVEACAAVAPTQMIITQRDTPGI